MSFRYQDSQAYGRDRQNNCNRHSEYQRMSNQYFPKSSKNFGDKRVGGRGSYVQKPTDYYASKESSNNMVDLRRDDRRLPQRNQLKQYCKDFLRHGSCRRANCKFMHIDEKLMAWLHHRSPNQLPMPPHVAEQYGFNEKFMPHKQWPVSPKNQQSLSENNKEYQDSYAIGKRDDDDRKPSRERISKSESRNERDERHQRHRSRAGSYERDYGRHQERLNSFEVRKQGNGRLQEHRLSDKLRDHREQHRNRRRNFDRHGRERVACTDIVGSNYGERHPVVQEKNLYRHTPYGPEDNTNSQKPHFESKRFGDYEAETIDGQKKMRNLRIQSAYNSDGERTMSVNNVERTVSVNNIEKSFDDQMLNAWDTKDYFGNESDKTWDSNHEKADKSGKVRLEKSAERCNVNINVDSLQNSEDEEGSYEYETESEENQ